MSFKIKPPYPIDNTPIYGADMENDVLGRTNKNGVILVNKNLGPQEVKKVIAHEEIHVDQFKNFELNYDDKNFYWKGKTYPRSKINEGNKNLPWEIPAYKASGYV